MTGPESDLSNVVYYSALMIRKGAAEFILEYYNQIENEKIKIDKERYNAFIYLAHANII
jgi:hypothetical protein